ncbi:MAG: hypothetical protein RLZZ474_633 [Bacteroidota bacterium]|jgi:hypothetical protein
MSVAIMQPYFFPYLGYFQLVQAVDDFVFYDDVMFIKKGWINRNRILMQGKEFLFTIPLEKQSQNKTIRESNVAWGPEFPGKFLVQLEAAYKKAPQFNQIMPLIQDLLAEQPASMAELAGKSIEFVWQYLGLQKRFHYSSELANNQADGRAERLIHLTKSLGSTQYINALNGQSLYEKDFFSSQGVELFFIKPSLQAYSQGKLASFEPGLSMIDVLMWNEPTVVVEMLKNFSLE